MGHKDSVITRQTYAKFLKNESTYNPDVIFEKSPVLVPNVPLVELEPVSELLN